METVTVAAIVIAVVVVYGAILWLSHLRWKKDFRKRCRKAIEEGHQRDIKRFSQD